MKNLILVLPLSLLIACASIFGETLKPETPIESVAATEILFQETIKTATLYRAQQIEAQDNQALVGVDATLIALTAGDRVSSLLAPIRDDGRTMTIDELDALIDNRDQLLTAYLEAGEGTSNTGKVTEFFEDLKQILDGARIALGAGDIAGAENARAKAIEALRTLRGILENSA